MAEWRYTVRLGDVWKNPDLSFEQQRDRIVERLRASQWIRDCGSDGGPLDRDLQDLAEVVDVVEFDDLWSEIYDYADANRAWIELT